MSTGNTKRILETIMNGKRVVDVLCQKMARMLLARQSSTKGRRGRLLRQKESVNDELNSNDIRLYWVTAIEVDNGS
jgi:hypothetical protein